MVSPLHLLPAQPVAKPCLFKLFTYEKMHVYVPVLVLGG